MLGRQGGRDIYAYCEPVDMRKGFEGLAALAREQMGKDPLGGAMFLFTNRDRNRAKILRFDGSGMTLYCKRLERGRFVALWNCTDNKTLYLKRSELELFLEGSHLVGRFAVSPAPLSEKDLEIRD